VTATSTRGAGWDTPVLIVGGMISGLSTALFLAHHGIESTVVERRADTLRHPRIRGISARTVELFRQVGLEPALREIDDSADEGSRIILAESLAGPEIQELVPPYEEVEEGISPAGEVLCDQDLLEPVLLERVRGAGGRVVFGSELVSFEQDGSGVRAVVRSVGSGVERVVRAGYLVACDGARSPVRERLGIACGGPGVFGHRASILFEADLTRYVQGRNLKICLIARYPGAGLLPRHAGRWQLTMPRDPDGGEEQFSAKRCVELVREAVGVPGLDVVFRSVEPWEVAGLVADRYQDGRVFLVGDAAHVMPSTGGFGGNVCVQDAHNLAWKLAAVLDGRAGPELLDTYAAERRPVGEVSMKEAVARTPMFMTQQPGAEPYEQHDHASVVFGYRYRSAAVLGEQPDDGEPLEDPRTASGRPGSRAAHLTVELGDRRMSVLDLFGREFVVLAGPEGAAWCKGAEAAGAALDTAVRAYQVGPPGGLRDVEGRWPQAYGVGEAGAVLVRPDGFVAWRTVDGPGPDPARTLESALSRALCRAPAAG